ncbi:MAG TPA: AAA family ATPase [Elusimicrobiota bacterium]|nr:AAA family ATPase [Elusimicrobiota bacterium]
MRKIKIFFINHWVKITVITLLILLIILTWVGLASLESFYRNLTLSTIPLQLLLTGLNAAVFVYLYMAVMQGGFGKLKKGAQIKLEDVHVSFKDCIGLENAKKEAMEVVQLLSDRARLKKIGGKIIKGLLMVGPPGCGKTMLAKAISTEAGIPFISMAGSEFVEVFVGVGASRVRKLFSKARQLAYAHGACIIFIDELDVIGRGRSFNAFGGGEETNSTQNQLLVEMDGLGAKEENVVVIGATNAGEEVLDKALLRPGRFDRKIYIDKPNLKEREDLFRYYMKKVQFDPNIDFPRLARKTVQKSPADIMNIVKESALIATRNKRDRVEYHDLSEAIERIDLGVAHILTMSLHEREAVAYHETGHLISLYHLHPTDDVFKASIISRGGALGVVHHTPREELYTADRNKLLADIQVALSGYVAEKIKYGVTSSGVSSDFQKAMRLAHAMVWRLGMGGDGILGDYTALAEHELSESMKQKLTDQVQSILSGAARDVEDLLKKEWTLVDRFAKELLERNELEYDDINAIFAEYGKARSPVLPASAGSAPAAVEPAPINTIPPAGVPGDHTPPTVS